jgi:hypothetical protein
MNNQQAGQWLDKEPRVDGKPRRWKPLEELDMDPSRVFIPQERRNLRPSDDTQLQDRTNI